MLAIKRCAREPRESIIKPSWCIGLHFLSLCLASRFSFTWRGCDDGVCGLFHPNRASKQFGEARNTITPLESIKEWSSSEVKAIAIRYFVKDATLRVRRSSCILDFIFQQTSKRKKRI